MLAGILSACFFVLVKGQKKLGNARPFNPPKSFSLYTPVFNDQLGERRSRYADLNFFEKDLVDTGFKSLNYTSEDGVKDLPVTPQYLNYVIDILNTVNTVIRKPPPLDSKPVNFQKPSSEADLKEASSNATNVLQRTFEKNTNPRRLLGEYESFLKTPNITTSAKIPKFEVNSRYKAPSYYSSVNSFQLDPKLKSLLTKYTPTIKESKMDQPRPPPFHIESKKYENKMPYTQFQSSYYSHQPLANSAGNIISSSKFVQKINEHITSEESSTSEDKFEAEVSDAPLEITKPIETKPEEVQLNTLKTMNHVTEPQDYNPDFHAALDTLSSLFSLKSPLNVLTDKKLSSLISEKTSLQRDRDEAIASSLKNLNLNKDTKNILKDYNEKSPEDLLKNNSNHSLLELLTPLALLDNYIDFGKKVPKTSNRYINYMFPKVKVPEQRWFDMVGSEIVHKNWRVNVVVAPIPLETVVQVGTDRFGISIMNNVIERQQMVEVSWDDIIFHEYSMLQSQEVAVGFFKNNIGAYVDVNKRARGVEVDILGTEAVNFGVYVDLTARDYGMRMTIKNVEVLFRHDFDDRFYPEPELYATEYGFRFRNVVGVFGGIDIPDTDYYFSINFRRFNFRIQRDFDERESLFNLGFGRYDLNKGFDIAIETNLPDRESSEAFIGVGMGRRNIAFVTVGAGVTHLGLPQAVIAIEKPGTNVNFGLRLDSKDKYEYSFSTRVGSTRYTYTTKIHPQHLRLPNALGFSPKKVTDFWKRIGLLKDSQS